MNFYVLKLQRTPRSKNRNSTAGHSNVQSLLLVTGSRCILQRTSLPEIRSLVNKYCFRRASLWAFEEHRTKRFSGAANATLTRSLMVLWTKANCVTHIMLQLLHRIAFSVCSSPCHDSTSLAVTALPCHTHDNIGASAPRCYNYRINTTTWAMMVHCMSSDSKVIVNVINLLLGYLATHSHSPSARQMLSVLFVQQIW